MLGQSGALPVCHVFLQGYDSIQQNGALQIAKHHQYCIETIRQVRLLYCLLNIKQHSRGVADREEN